MTPLWWVTEETLAAYGEELAREALDITAYLVDGTFGITLRQMALALNAVPLGCRFGWLIEDGPRARTAYRARVRRRNSRRRR